MTTVSQDLLQRFDIPGPRYTSYPTADRFVEAFGAASICARGARRTGAPAPAAAASPLSLYVHIPFCESLCYYCACNKIVTQAARARRRLPAMRSTREMALLRRRARARSARHPTAPGRRHADLPVRRRELTQLMTMLQRTFALAPGARAFDRDRPAHRRRARGSNTCAALGFNRISFGVQDFDPEVQKAVHRVQPAEQVVAADGGGARAAASNRSTST